MCGEVVPKSSKVGLEVAQPTLFWKGVSSLKDSKGEGGRRWKEEAEAAISSNAPACAAGSPGKGAQMQLDAAGKARPICFSGTRTGQFGAVHLLGTSH